MAATDVMPSSPMTPGNTAPWSSFEDYLDFPSPLATPRLAPLAAPSFSQASQSGLQQTPSQSTQVNSTSVALQSASPPPPGSSPEVLFRYYLAAELRRIGSSADDAIIDRYVAQHYDSFTRALDRQQNQTNAVPKQVVSDDELLTPTQASTTQAQFDEQSNMNGVAAFRSPSSTGPSSAPYLLSNDGYAGQSINPHLMELSSVHQPFTVSRLPSTSDKHNSTLTSSESKGKFREGSADDDMSEDEEEEDDKDGLADLVKKLKTSPASSRAASHGVTGLEETPIAGSIMGPANELRPDPEAYRKLSSKEKRQLRNKISARNFRTRRKEHIAHLEEQVADRDTIIEGLRQQLALVKVQNKDLTDEVRVLKSKSISNADVSRIIEALQKGAASSSTATDMGPPSHLLRSSSNSSLSDTFNNGRPSTPASPRPNSPRPLLARPNMRKDLPASASANSSKSFWGGVGGTGNNFMSVHTVLVPQLFSWEAPNHDTKAHLPTAPSVSAFDESVSVLSRLVEEKLSVGEQDKKQVESVNGKTIASGMAESDVNEAIVSLLGEQDVAPPCYSEAIATPPVAESSSSSSSTSLDLNNEQIHATVLAALNKAFSSSPSTTSHSKATSSLPQLDASKIQALLDGRATLVLFDEQKGQLWKNEGESSDVSTANHAMPISV